MQRPVTPSQCVAGHRVERAERFVHQHQPRCAGERAGEPHPLPLSARQGFGIAVRKILWQVDEIE